MGAELERRQRITPPSIGQLFDECCPFYMSIGMSYKEFWEGDVCLPKFYLRAYKIKQEREQQESNFRAWLDGTYTMKAFEVVLQNAFAKDGTPPAEYFDKPVPLTEKQQEKRKEENAEAEKLRVKVALDNFINMYKKERSVENGRRSNNRQPDDRDRQ